MRRLLIVVACLGLGSGCLGSCFDSGATDFPDGLEPLEDNTAPAMPPAGGDPYPEGLSLVLGTNDMYSWGHGRGWIKAPAAVVWEVVKDPMVIADRRKTDEQTYMLDTEPEYEWSYQIHYVVHDLIDVDWDEAFRFGTIEGTPEAPKLALARSQKVYGLNIIHLIEGSIIVRHVDDQTCEVEIIRHLDAYMAGEGDIQSYIEDMYASIRAVAHGEPLPTY